MDLFDKLGYDLTLHCANFVINSIIVIPSINCFSLTLITSFLYNKIIFSVNSSTSFFLFSCEINEYT